MGYEGRSHPPSVQPALIWRAGVAYAGSLLIAQLPPRAHVVESFRGRSRTGLSRGSKKPACNRSRSTRFARGARLHQEHDAVIRRDPCISASTGKVVDSGHAKHRPYRFMVR